MATEDNASRVTLHNVRLSFPHLREPSESVSGGPKKYRSQFIIDPATPDGKNNIAKIRKAIAAAELKTFGKTGIVDKIRDPKRVAFFDGDDKTNADGDVYDGWEGMKGVKGTSNKRPVLWDRSNNPVQLEDIDDMFVAGYYVDTSVTFYCVKDKEKGGNGLFVGINVVRYRKKGETFGAAPVDPDEFEALDDDDDDDEDDLPF